MDPKQLRTLYGRRCRAVVQCHPCGRQHVVMGVLGPGRRAGDVALEGQTYSSSDVLRITPETPVASRRLVGLPAAQLLVLAGAMLAWLELVARH